MKVVKYKENELILQNIENKDEELLFKSLEEKLLTNKDVSFTKTVNAPYCDIYDGLFSNMEFTLIYDFNYGTILRSSSVDCLSALEQYINN